MAYDMIATLPLEILGIVACHAESADTLSLVRTSRRASKFLVDELYRYDILHQRYDGFLWACCEGNVTLVELCLRYRAPINHVFDSCQWARFLRRTNHPQPHVLGRLVGLAPLSISIVRGHFDLALHLINNNAEVNNTRAVIQDERGLSDWVIGGLETPVNHVLTVMVMCTEAYMDKGLEVLTTLLRRGADPNGEVVFPAADLGLAPTIFVRPVMQALNPAIPTRALQILLENGADPTLQSLNPSWVVEWPTFPSFTNPFGLLRFYIEREYPLTTSMQEKLHILRQYHPSSPTRQAN